MTFVMLDRDGVINEDSPDYIKSPEEWHPVPGSIEAICRLSAHNIPVFVATNQAGIARGKLDRQALAAIHDKMLQTVIASGGTISDIRFCPHHPDEQCACRKPAPGLLMQLAEAHHLELADGYFVGDSLKDLRAAEAAGCTGVLVLTGNGQTTLQLRPQHPLVFDNLSAFVDHLLG